MFTKLVVFIFLLLMSFNVLACGGGDFSIIEELLIIISLGLILACVFMLPLSIVLFNTHNSSSHIIYFISYFACAVIIIITLFYANNELGLYLTVFLSLFCAMPTIHTLVMAFTKSNQNGKNRAAD